MPNIAAVLKDEISRIARKEVRKQVEPLRKQLAVQRRDLAALKKERADLRRQLAAANKPARRGPAAEEAGEQGAAKRFSAAGLKSLRARLGLSAEKFGALVGVSGASVYFWEQGKVRPRAQQIERIAALRGMGKRKALALLDAQPAPARRAAPAKRARARK